MYADSSFGRAIRRPLMAATNVLYSRLMCGSQASSSLDTDCTEEDTAYLVVPKEEEFAIASAALLAGTRLRSRVGGRDAAEVKGERDRGPGGRLSHPCAMLGLSAAPASLLVPLANRVVD